MSRYWSDVVGQLTPYVPGEQPRGAGLVKLNTNESPYGPSPKVREVLAAFDGERLRLYPDPESQQLKQAFARYYSLEPDQVFLGNGSDEVLAHAFQALLRHEGPVLFPDVSYSFYPVWCQLYGLSCRQVPLAADFSVDTAAYPKDNGGIIIPNPNAPTGVLMELADIRQLLESHPDSVIVIDEAYIDFGGESAVQLIDDYDNLLVVQTLSKSRALAGLRIGVAMGHPALVQGLERVKNSFNSYPLGTLTQQAGLAALEDEEYFREICQRVIASRERLRDAMLTLGFKVLPSAANFLLASHPQKAARDIFTGLRDRGIIVRYFDRPRIDEFLRISVGTDAQCGQLLSALREILG